MKRARVEATLSGRYAGTASRLLFDLVWPFIWNLAKKDRTFAAELRLVHPALSNFAPLRRLVDADIVRRPAFDEIASRIWVDFADCPIYVPMDRVVTNPRTEEVVLHGETFAALELKIHSHRVVDPYTAITARVQPTVVMMPSTLAELALAVWCAMCDCRAGPSSGMAYLFFPTWLCPKQTFISFFALSADRFMRLRCLGKLRRFAAHAPDRQAAAFFADVCSTNGRRDGLAPFARLEEFVMRWYKETPTAGRSLSPSKVGPNYVPIQFENEGVH